MSENGEKRNDKKGTGWKPDPKITMTIRKGKDWKPDKKLIMKFQESVAKKEKDTK